MSVIFDPKTGPLARKSVPEDEALNRKHIDQAREYRRVALFALMLLLVWIACLALLGYGIGWLYFWHRAPV